MTGEGHRIVEVQSLRAIAILLVAGYHYFAAWTMPIDGNDVYPGTLASLFKHAWLGVELFFMVSGFVIAMTLLRSQSALDFLIKRAIRLWPALFIALPVVWLVGNVFGPDIYSRSLTSLFTSLTLIEPALFNDAFQINVDWTTAVLWTMWVEVQFYLLAGLLFFALRTRFLTGLGAVTAATTAWIVLTDSDILPSLALYLPWFLAGAIFHRIWSTGETRLVDLGALVSVLAYESWELWFFGSSDAIWLPVLFFMAFTAIVRHWRVTAVLRAGGLVFVGEISYELYLVHDTLGVTVIHQMVERFGFSGGPHLFGVVLGLMISIAVAYAAYRSTMPIRRALTARLRSHQSVMTASS